MSTPETVQADAVVSIHFKLSLQGGEVVDGSEGGDPWEYLHGHGNIVPGLESQVAGRKIGDQFKVEVAPGEGYGDHDPSQLIQAPRSSFPEDVELEPGMQFETEDEDGGTAMATISAVGDEEITLDLNHPLAGQTLLFEIEIAGIRTATAEELEHGHAHGPEGHQH